MRSVQSLVDLILVYVQLGFTVFDIETRVGCMVLSLYLLWSPYYNNQQQNVVKQNNIIQLSSYHRPTAFLLNKTDQKHTVKA